MTIKPNLKAIWKRVGKYGAAVGAFVAASAAIATGLTTVAGAFPKLLPFWAPFDASLALRDIRLLKTAATEHDFDSKRQPAIELRIEYVEEKTGPSTLRMCRPELKAQDVYTAESWPARPHTLADDTQALVSESFVIRKQDFSRSMAMRLVCERRVTLWKEFTVPDVAITSDKTTYYLCLGEHREACGGTPNWIPCSGNVTAWAKSSHPGECVNVDYKKISDVSGNKCGYATFEVTCLR